MRCAGKNAAGTAVRLASAIASLLLILPAQAGAEPRHGWSVFGDLKYPSSFKHFDYVNPGAPKGGALSTIGTSAVLTFDSFNGFILKGDAAQGLDLVYDTLLARAYDEPDASYGLLAESIDVASDRMSVTFRLRPAARFADGSPVTADDCVFSFETIKAKGHPLRSAPLRDVEKAEALDALAVKFTFKGKEVRDLPGIIGTMPILPRKFYDKVAFDETWLEKPLGSGPYEIADFKQGTHVTYQRRDGYWGKDLPVNRGRYNFDKVRFDYFRDRTAGLQALKAGQVDLREEFTSKEWATGYDIPPVKAGRLILVTLPDQSPSGTQGFFINTRRDKLKDVRVRQALDHAFDFEWTNKNLFFGLYTRTQSYFENSALKATGKPSEAELALAKSKGLTLAEGFAELPVYSPPVSDGSGLDRKQIGKAAQLLTEAGWVVKGGKRVNAAGEPLSIEFMVGDPTSERLLGNYVNVLRDKLGLEVAVRRVDEAQYQRRFKAFDFDVVIARFSMLPTPGLELKQYFGSEAASRDGSRNLAGIRDPLIDTLIDGIASTTSRSELGAYVRLLDRVLLAGHYWVPHWYKASHTIAHWDKFSRPEKKPDFDRGVIDTWWYDAAKDAKLRAAQ